MNDKLKRRDFIKTSGTLATGAIVGSSIVGSAYAAGSDIIKIALIGCGGRGTGAVFDAYASGQTVQLVAMADVFQENLDKTYKTIKAKFGNKIDVPESRRYVGLEAYKSAIADADVVILTTPPGFRPDHFQEAVKAGKHVFMEKPVAVDVPGIRKVLDAAKVAKE
ncbi:MAG TPA: Gfo/Idh/MocA family oxidoreductase, partial [Candidatus Sphingobacterium stercoripullorum]|nr:Gfo/Idh/MocA family oxidoreductase [Candidatus Sphingobacterium stercoripullorum]